MSYIPTQRLSEDNDRNTDDESEQSVLDFEFDDSVLLPDGTPPMLTRRTLNLEDTSSVMDDNDTSSAWIEFESTITDSESLPYMLHISCDLQSEDDNKIPRCLLNRSQNNADCDTDTADNKTRFDFSHADRDRDITQVRQILHRNERNHRSLMQQSTRYKQYIQHTTHNIHTIYTHSIIYTLYFCMKNVFHINVCLYVLSIYCMS